MVAVVAVLVVILVLAVVLRTATVALTLTGLSHEVAAFQVRSAFFGVGYTTAEAESVVNHPVRRRIVSWLIVLGAIGITGIIGSIVVTLARSGQSIAGPIAALVGGLAALWLVWRFKPLERALVHVIERLLRRYTDLDSHDYAALLRLSGDWTVRQIPIRANGWLAGRGLEEVTDAIVLGIERADGSYVGAPSIGTVLESGDTLTVYGRNELLERLTGTVSD